MVLFKKGRIPWNKGKKNVMPIPWNKGKKGLQIAWNKGKKGYHVHTKESREKLRLARAKQIITDEHKKNISIANKGKHTSIVTEFKTGHKMSIETRKKISEAHKGIKRKPFSVETIRKMKENRAKQILPKKDTSIEVKIQNFLKQLGVSFFTHQYMKEIEHSYHCDILIPSINLVIECDGNYWHKYPIGKDIDHIRTSELLNKGFKVLRLWGSEIRNMSLNQFRDKIKNRGD